MAKKELPSTDLTIFEQRLIHRVWRYSDAPFYCIEFTDGSKMEIRATNGVNGMGTVELSFVGEVKVVEALNG